MKKGSISPTRMTDLKGAYLGGNLKRLDKLAKKYHITDTRLEELKATWDEAPLIHGNSHYNPTYPRLLVEYFNKELEAFEFVDLDKGDFKVKPHKLPTVAGFCRTVGIGKDVFTRWIQSGRYPALMEAYDLAMTCQEALLVEGASVGGYKTEFMRFMLKNHHGYHDAGTNVINVNNHIDADYEELERFYEEGKRRTREMQEAIKGRRKEITGHDD